MNLSKRLELKFGNEDIPLFLRANPHKIAALSYVFALFEGTEPTEKHVEQAYDWLTQCGVDLELDEYTTQWKEEHKLSEEDYQALDEAISKKIIEEMQAGGDFKETTLYQFLDYIARHGQAQMEEIAAASRVSDATVKRRAKEMKGLGLVKSSRNGYFFTVKGVRFWKKWLKEAGIIHSGQKKFNGDPDDLNDLKTEGQAVFLGGKKEVTPENEVNKVNEVTIEEELRLFINSLSPEKKAFLKTVKHITPLKEPANGECYVCEKNKDLTWQIGVSDDVTKGLWGFLCMGCAPKVMMMNRVGENKE